MIIQLFSTLGMVLDFRTLFLFLKQSGEKSHQCLWGHEAGRGTCQVPGNSVLKVSSYHRALTGCQLSEGPSG